MPKISVIVPIYNVEQYVGDCLQSLVTQTLSDIEIICVNDCGKDKSMQIVKDFATRDKRIRIVKNWRNRGLSYSRNHGMRYARAPYIMFCDSDDMFMSDTCEKMYNAITELKTDVVVGNINVIYEADHDLKESDAKFFRVPSVGAFDIPENSKYICYGSAWGKIFRRDVIVDNKLTFPNGLKHEDEFFWPAFCSVARRVGFIDDIVYQYRRRAGSIMNVAYQQNKLNLDPLKILERYFKYTNKHNVFWAQRDWFWGVMMPGMLAAALRYSGDKNKDKCFAMLRRFIRRNYSPYGLNEQVQKFVSDTLSKAEN